jgi:hypothetical protein
MEHTSGGTTDAHSPEPRREEDEAPESDREEQYHAIIESDPLLEEVGEANQKAGDPSEPRRVVPSKPC